MLIQYEKRNGDDFILKGSFKFICAGIAVVLVLAPLVLKVAGSSNTIQSAGDTALQRNSLIRIGVLTNGAPILSPVASPAISPAPPPTHTPLVTPSKAEYTEDELYMMSHLIGGEAGASWASDIHQQLVGMVVMNRIDSHLFPDTMKEVIFQKGQYACTWDGNYDKKPSDRAVENAKKVLTGDTDIECPPNVVFQSTRKLGDGVFYKIYDKILNNTTYFCYSNK